MSVPISAMIVSAARSAHPGDAGQLVPGPSERGDHRIDAAVQCRDGALQVLLVRQCRAHQQGMVVAEPAP
jgi:hypothetical protein